MLTRKLWMVGALLHLVVLPLERELGAVLARRHSWTHIAGVTLVLECIVVGIIAIAARRFSSAQRVECSVARAAGWTMLYACIAGLAASLLMTLAWYCMNTVVSLVAVLLLFVTVFPAIMAGYFCLPPGAAVVRSIPLIRYLWLVIGIYIMRLGMGYLAPSRQDIVFEMLWMLICATVYGVLWTALVVFAIRKVSPGELGVDFDGRTGRSVVVDLCRNLLLAYVAAIVNWLVVYVVPESFLRWNPLFGKWDFWINSFGQTTGSILISVCIVILLVWVARGPGWQRVLSVGAYWIVYVSVFPGWIYLPRNVTAFVDSQGTASRYVPTDILAVNIVGLALFLCVGLVSLLVIRRCSLLLNRRRRAALG